MTVTLTFNANEEREELATALNAHLWKRIVEELDQYLRGKVKYGMDLTSDQSAMCQTIRDFLHDLIKDAGVELFGGADAIVASGGPVPNR